MQTEYIRRFLKHSNYLNNEVDLLTDLQKAEKAFMAKWAEAVKAAAGDPDRLMDGTSDLIASMDKTDVALLEEAMQAELFFAAPATLN